MANQTLLIIRHAEKPDDNGNSGVDANGNPDAKSLTPRGWQRAGAWVQLFSPSFGSPVLPSPDVIFASAPSTHQEIAAGSGGSKSRRPLETVTPLAQKLNLTVDLSFSKGRENDLASAIPSAGSIVLVCWQHEDIPAIANALAPSLAVPSKWPGDRFNVIFRFDRASNSSPWVFSQVVPVMFSDDSSSEI